MSRVFALLLVVVAGLGLAELLLAPSAGDRFAFAFIFAALGLVAGLLGLWLPRALEALRSLRVAIGLVALAAAVMVVLAVGATAQVMFVSVHDTRTLAITLVVAAGFGLLVAAHAAAPLVRDLGLLRATANRVSEGDLSAVTALRRDDEMGQVGGALDEMVQRLAAIERQRERLQAERRLVLAAVGHDLRTPLTALRAAVEALQDGVSPDPGRYVIAMRHDLDALEALTEELFLLARVEAQTLEIPRDDVDLAELVDEAVEALAPVGRRKGVRVLVETGGPVRVRGGASELGRVVRNLLDNALRHSPDRGTVHVAVLVRDEAIVRVRDEGPGFPAAFAARAFDPFTKADPARGPGSGAAGLGLALARRLVEAHDGRVWIEPGTGACVCIALPLLDAPTTAADRRATTDV